MKILYVNGDSHSAAAEAVNPYSWAEDDGLYYGLGKQPHPDNERVSFGCELANYLGAVLWLDAQAGCSNSRIIRTTNEWISKNQDNLKQALLVIQWSTWEREEWLYNGEYYQVNASGVDHVPPELEYRYKQFVSDINWKQCQQQSHDEIWQFHQKLKSQNISHIMFNGNNHFEEIQHRYDWGTHYIGPYEPALTYDSVLKNNGYSTVNPQSWHFGSDAHCFWAEYLLQYLNENFKL
jgi:hypothetical protein